MWSESLRGSMHIAQRETKSERGEGKGCYRMQFAPRLAVLPVARGNRKPFPPSFRPPSTPALSPSTTPSSSAPSLPLLSSAPLVPSSSGLSLHRPPTPPPPPRIWVEGRESAEGRGGTVCASENETTYRFFRPKFRIISCWRKIQSQLSNSFHHTISEFQCKWGQLCTREGQSGHAGRQREREREESALALMGVTRPLSSLPSAGAARRPTNHVVALNHVSSEGGPLRFLNRVGSL